MATTAPPTTTTTTTTTADTCVQELQHELAVLNHVASTITFRTNRIESFMTMANSRAEKTKSLLAALQAMARTTANKWSCTEVEDEAKEAVTDALNVAKRCTSVMERLNNFTMATTAPPTTTMTTTTTTTADTCVRELQHELAVLNHVASTITSNTESIESNMTTANRRAKENKPLLAALQAMAKTTANKWSRTEVEEEVGKAVTDALNVAKRCTSVMERLNNFFV